MHIADFTLNKKNMPAIVQLNKCNVLQCALMLVTENASVTIATSTNPKSSHLKTFAPK